MKVCLTVDVEQDCPPFMETFRGIEEGLPKLLSLLARRQVAATFFTTGDVARRYPAAIRAGGPGHELGCHGDTHRRFDYVQRGGDRGRKFKRPPPRCGRLPPWCRFAH